MMIQFNYLILQMLVFC